MRTLVIKGAAGMLLAALALVCGSIPEMVRQMAIVATLFVSLDTVSGVIAAAANHEVSSHTLKMRLLLKGAQYALLVGLGVGLAIIAGSWMPVAAALSGIVGIETISMCENLTRLEKAGGVPLGPIRPLIQRIAKYLTDGLPGADSLPAPGLSTSAETSAEGARNVRQAIGLDLSSGAAPVERVGAEAGDADKAESSEDRSG